jgi:rhomboid family GlyGly-CTERM serine protease
MGLRQGDSEHWNIGSFSAWPQLLAVMLTAVVVGLLGDLARDALAFDREAIAAGQAWRLVSAHFVHLGLSHLLYNLTGLCLVWYLVSRALSGSNWLIVWLCSIPAVSLGLWLFEPQLEWYVGLSGVIHGLLAAGILGEISKQRLETWVLAIVLVAKIAWEQFVGPMPGSGAASGGDVIVDAHLYGAMGGLVASAIIMIRVRAKASI